MQDLLCSGRLKPKEFARLAREGGMQARKVAEVLRSFLTGLGGAPPPSLPPLLSPLGLRLVIISDTHGSHRALTMPEGDVLIHGGDFTRYGRREDALDFNVWLGELPHRYKVVVFGNHEANAPWAAEAASLMTNATLLRQSVIELPTPPKEVGGAPQILRVFGTDFFWPMKTPNPHFDQIPADTDVLVAHGPAWGHVDNGSGCKELLRHVERVQPRVLCSGHIHGAHGVCQGKGSLRSTTFVNAANAKHGHAHMGWDPVVLDI